MPAAVAFGYQYIHDNHSPARVVHLHTGAYDVYNLINQNDAMKARANDAIDDWHDALSARHTVQMNRTSTGTNAEVKLSDGRDSGAAVVYQENFHQATAVAVSFRSGQQGEGAWSGDQKQHKACNVLGNILGLDDASTSGDCMQPGIDFPTIDGAGAAKVRDFYGPSVSLDGPLANRNDIKTTGSYDVSSTGDGHGIESVTLKLDGDVIGTKAPPSCDEHCSPTASPSSPVDGLSPGPHTLTGTAKNEFGQMSTQTIALSVKAPNPDWGFTDRWQQASNLAEIPSTGRATPASLGATTARLNVKWSDVEENAPVNGVHDYTWGSYASAYDAMRAEKQKPIIDLTDAPDWASGQDADACGSFGTDCQHPPNPAHYPGWRAFVAAAVDRFPDALAYEIWNEPNFKKYWFPGADADAYADVLHNARLGANDADATHPIVTGGLSPGSDDSTKVAQDDFLRQLYLDGGAPDFDGIGEHVYVNGASPSVWAAGQTQLVQELRTVRDNRDSRTPPPPFWLTEVGVSTSPGFTGGRTVEAADQGPTLKAMYNATDSDVKAFIVFRYHDMADQGDMDLFGHMGIVTSNYAHKQAFAFLACELGGRNC
jgi:hypothetical protein